MPDTAADLASSQGETKSTPVAVRKAREMTQVVHTRGTQIMISAAQEELRIDQDLEIRREQALATALTAGKIVADLRIKAILSERACPSSPEEGS